jgi:predicted RNA binding protein YcfA (HicA-like mRNA interferase family)
MSQLPQIDSRRLLRALERAGFQRIRQTGSHVILRHPDAREIEVPMHDRDLKPGTLEAILKEASITADELRDLE